MEFTAIFSLFYIFERKFGNLIAFICIAKCASPKIVHLMCAWARPISISRTICPNLMLEKWKPALIVRDHLVHYSLICQWHMIVSHVIWSTHRSVFFSPFLIFFMCFIPCYKQCTLPKIPQFYLIYWCGNFVP